MGWAKPALWTDLVPESMSPMPCSKGAQASMVQHCRDLLEEEKEKKNGKKSEKKKEQQKEKQKPLGVTKKKKPKMGVKGEQMSLALKDGQESLALENGQESLALEDGQKSLALEGGPGILALEDGQVSLDEKLEVKEKMNKIVLKRPCAAALETVEQNTKKKRATISKEQAMKPCHVSIRTQTEEWDT